MFFARTEFISVRKTKEPAATTNETQPEQCKEPQPQEPVEPVTEANELPSHSAVEVPTELKYLRRLHP